MSDLIPTRSDLEESPPARISRRTWRTVISGARVADWALEGLSIGLVVAAAVGFASYAGRRALVGELAEDFLRGRGIESAVEVYEVDARGFVGRVRLGPAADPDFAAERMEVLLASPPPPEGPYALRPRSILIRGPELKARWTGERLSFGALDPLVQEFLSRPPDPSRPSPRVIIDEGALRLATPWGLVRASGDAVVDDSRLQQLDLVLRPTSLASAGVKAELREGRAAVRVRGEAVEARLHLDLARLDAGDAGLKNADLRLDARTVYPDLATRRFYGPLQVTAALAADRADFGGPEAAGLKLDLALGGALQGPFNRPGYAGAAELSARAASLRSDGARLQTARLGARFAQLDLRPSDDGLAGRGAVEAAFSAARAVSPAADLGNPSLTLASAGFDVHSRADAVSARGPVRLGFGADRLASGDLAVRAVRVSASSSAAELRAGTGALAATGALRATVEAGGAALRGSAELGALRAELSTNLGLLTGASAPVSGRAALDRLTLASAPLVASDARLQFNGRASRGGYALNGALQGRGALPAGPARRMAEDLPVLGDEPAYAAAVARVLSGFRLDAPGLSLASSDSGPQLRITRPVEVRGEAGGALARLEPGPGGFAPLGRGGSGFSLALAGGGLPSIETTVSRYRRDAGGFDADLRIRAALNAASARGATVEARGRATSRDGAFTFSAADCLGFRAERIELGENDVENLESRFCPDGEGALVRTSGSGLRVRGRFDRASADVPFLQARITNGAGTVDASGGASGLTAIVARIAGAEAADTATERRFHPVALLGNARLGEGRWTADLDISDAPAGTALARAALTHDAVAGRGGVVITADDLRFTPDGLQPHDLSPMAVGLVSAVDGSVDFEGEIRWTEAGATSRGRVAANGLSLDSPAGRVVGLRTALQLSSLAPITAPVGQAVTAERIEAFSPLTDVSATLGIDETAVQLQSASAGFAGGRLELEPLAVSLAENRTLSGAVRLDEVDLGALIAETGFADKVALQAVVDGRIPFQTGPAGLRFAGGELRSTRPGRLSVSRTALGQVSGSGGPSAAEAAEARSPASTADGEGAAPTSEAAPPNAFQDFAYQALENLAYEELSVAVDSRPGGRLGMIFSVNGRHDPPNPEQARVGLFDLLRGRAFQKRIPLPDGAPVNLTLDASINFDELLGTYLDLQRARNLERSAPVQADPPRSGAQ